MKKTFIVLSLFFHCFFLVAQNHADIDANFNVISGYGLPGGYPGMVTTISIQDDGKILTGGSFMFYNGQVSKNLVRLTPDGDFDPTFNVGNGFNDVVNEIITLDDGKIIVIGGFTVYDNTPASGIIKLNEDGSVDTTFNSGNGFLNPNSTLIVSAIAIQTDGKMVVGGSFNHYDGTLVGKVVRLNTDGSLDTSFEAFGFSNHTVGSIAMQDDGKILVGGRFTYNYPAGNSTKGIVRLLPDGTRDMSFNTGSGFTSSTSSTSIKSILVMQDGRLLLSGSFTGFNGIAAEAMIRLFSDGSIDPTFNIFTSPNNIDIIDVALQDDGKILAGGFFNQYDQTLSNYLIRLDQNGYVDSSFNVGTGFNNGPYSIKIQQDGKIIIGGHFQYYNNVNLRGIVRLIGSPPLSVYQNDYQNFNVYPNPTKSILHFSEILKNIKVYDFSGREVMNISTFNKKIQLSILPEGIYLLKAETQTGKSVQVKILKKY